MTLALVPDIFKLLTEVLWALLAPGRKLDAALRDQSGSRLGARRRLIGIAVSALALKRWVLYADNCDA